VYNTYKKLKLSENGNVNTVVIV